MGERKDTEEKIFARITELKIKRFMVEIDKIKGMNGRTTSVFKLAEKIIGPKKNSPEATAVQDPKTKEIKTSKKDIIDTYLNHCAEVIKKNEPSDGYHKESTLKHE